MDLKLSNFWFEYKWEEGFPFIKKLMKTIILFVVMTVCACWNFKELNGPTATPLALRCIDSSVSIDGKFFYCSIRIVYKLEIYKNNGSGFSLMQVF